ncbi:OmpA family protein [Rhizosphaericola mali]|uniref:OmpA family protein n=1 Tax=Rhizosphaericola mali TaxID=2545455 RepID=A0A5P2FW38_9BACT|nr:OmpA family protein [Rhizosphaericola mali]QES87734.1 OmpA family protein [Rhizosphaericola mali]
MINKMNKKVIMAALAAAVAGTVSAQDATSDSLQASEQGRVVPFSGVEGMRTWSFGFYGGGSAPFGLPNGSGNYFNNFNPKTVDLLYGGYLRKQLSHNFALQADFMRGVVKGSVKGSQTTTSSIRGGVADATDFKTSIDYAISMNAVFNFGTVNWLHGKTAFIPYVTAGGGTMRFKTENDGQLVPTTGGNTYRNEFYLPVGIGAKFILSNTVNLDLNYKVNLVNAKDFDGVSNTTYNNRDQFSQLNLGLEFAIGKKNKPQLIQHNPAHALAQDLWDKNNALKAQLAAQQEELEAQSAKHNTDVANLQSQLDAAKVDSDGDGVSDLFDKCPNTPSGTQVDGSGCPIKLTNTIIKQERVITKEDQQVVTDAVKNLEFDFAKATIREHSDAALDRLADLLKAKNFNLKLSGYTDNVGSVAANLKLSKERANAVKEYLVAQGVNESQIVSEGFGKANPIASNKTEAGRQMNRRVEFKLF